jgi:hypothetical protein
LIIDSKNHPGALLPAPPMTPPTPVPAPEEKPPDKVKRPTEQDRNRELGR